MQGLVSEELNSVETPDSLESERVLVGVSEELNSVETVSRGDPSDCES